MECVFCIGALHNFIPLGCHTVKPNSTTEEVSSLKVRKYINDKNLVDW